MNINWDLVWSVLVLVAGVTGWLVRHWTPSGAVPVGQLVPKEPTNDTERLMLATHQVLTLLVKQPGHPRLNAVLETLLDLQGEPKPAVPPPASAAATSPAKPTIYMPPAEPEQSDPR